MAVEYTWPAKDKTHTLGKRVKRLDGMQKATGAAKYTYDVNLKNQLIAKGLGCPHGHCMIKSIDVAPALKVAGVVEAMPLHKSGDEIEFHIHQPGGTQTKMWVSRETLQKSLEGWKRAGGSAEPISVAGRTARKEAQIVFVVNDDDEEIEVQAGWWIWVPRTDLKAAFDPWSWRNWLDAGVGLLTLWFAEDVFGTEVKRRLKKIAAIEARSGTI